MSIYELEGYGVWYHFRLEFTGVNIYAKKEERHKVPGFENLFFKINLLKDYKGKKDVLKLEFEDGTCMYETLNAPFKYFEDGVWKKSYNPSTPEAFMRLYFSSV